MKIYYFNISRHYESLGKRKAHNKFLKFPMEIHGHYKNKFPSFGGDGSSGSFCSLSLVVINIRYSLLTLSRIFRCLSM